MFERHSSQWKLGATTESVGGRLWVAATLCLADHLGDDGKPDREAIAERAVELLEQGAQLLDIQAYSGKVRASADEELRRYVPVLRKLVTHIAVPLVITTSHAETRERVAGLGADIIRESERIAQGSTTRANGSSNRRSAPARRRRCTCP